jgi:hypothetical protein
MRTSSGALYIRRRAMLAKRLAAILDRPLELRVARSAQPTGVAG